MLAAVGAVATLVARFDIVVERNAPPDNPPPGHGEHRYAFQVFALAPGDAFSGTPGRDALLEAIRQRGLASGLLVGTYARPDGTIRNDAPQAVRVGVPPV